MVEIVGSIPFLHHTQSPCIGYGMVRWGSPETPSHKQTNDYEILRRTINFSLIDGLVYVWLSCIDGDDMKKVWNGWLRERKHNKCFTDRMKKIDKKCVDEIEKNEHLTGEDYASSILEDMDEFEIRGPFLN